MDLLHGLNDAQIAAVTAPPGPVLVLAGPGSGKTRVLTHRIVYLIETLRLAPWRIMAVTFTNKAAREMRGRIEALLGGDLRGLSMGTFHATCARILRRESDNLTYYGRDFVIFDTADQLQAIKQVLKELNLDDKKFPPNKLLHGISSAKNELVTPDQYAAANYVAEITRRVYTHYQALLQANNAMDFDDLLMQTVLLFDERADVLQKYQERYAAILVDEFQDTNTTQYTLLKMLATPRRSIFAVGDSDQSIYKWRGADFRNIERFREQYPDAQLILLEQNYRSTQIILDAAKAVIRHNPNRVHKELFTLRQGGRRIVVREAYNEYEEADQVIDAITSLLLDGYGSGDIAVMYRTNAQSRVLEEAFVRARLPYRVVGATEFYKRREVKDLIAFLRVVHNPADGVSYGRIVNVPPRGIGAKTHAELESWAAQQGRQPAEAAIQLAINPDAPHAFSGRALNALRNFGELLNAWVTLRDQVSVADLIDVILEQTGYHGYLDDGTEEGEERWANVMELRNVATESSELTLSEFLEQVALVSDTDRMDEGVNVTSLLTLHAAKGLEFPIVFLTGLEDGVLPHSRSLGDGEELAEERRLFYVGITRAKDRVYISHTFRRTFFGDSSVSTPSRFLRDIPDDLLDGDTPGRRREQSKQRAGAWGGSATPAWSPRRARETSPATSSSSSGRSARRADQRDALPPPNYLRQDSPEEAPPAPRVQARYRTGQKVRHARFGEGLVIESKLTGSDEEVTVAFQSVGIKRLAASFANLEQVNG
jgi:DNA helicase II / ATP-dependent DNA helicase PcrA